MPGLPWNMTKWTITVKKEPENDNPVSLTYTEEILNDIRIKISNTQYKSLKVITLDTSDEYTDILHNKLNVDVECLQIDQDHFDVGDIVKFEYTDTDKKWSVIHLSTHALIESSLHQFIPNVYLLLIKSGKYVNFQTIVTNEWTGPFVRCYVNLQNELIVYNHGNFDIEQIFE